MQKGRIRIRPLNRTLVLVPSGILSTFRIREKDHWSQSRWRLTPAGEAPHIPARSAAGALRFRNDSRHTVGERCEELRTLGVHSLGRGCALGDGTDDPDRSGCAGRTDDVSTPSYGRPYPDHGRNTDRHRRQPPEMRRTWRRAR